jgi:hypothetical protein
MFTPRSRSSFNNAASGAALSIDHTMHAASKAVVVSSNKQQVKLFMGLFSAINEHSQIVAWVRYFPCSILLCSPDYTALVSNRKL